MNSEFTCAQCRDALPGYVAGTLARTVRLSVERHLVACDACQQAHAQWRVLADLAHQADAQTPAASVQSATGTWAAIQTRILSESPFTTGAYSVNNSQHDSPPTQGTAPILSTPPPHTRPALGQRRIPMGATAVVAALLLVAIAVGLFASHLHRGLATPGLGWQSPSGDLMGIVYLGSDALSPTDVWAVGYGSNRASVSVSGGGFTHAVSSVISHFDGKQWHIDESAVFAGVRLYAISMDSPTDGWAVGFRSSSTDQFESSFLVHYTQGHWVPQTGNLPVASLLQVQMFGPDAGWATGIGSDDGPAIFHYQHGVWMQTTFAPLPIASPNAVPPAVATNATPAPKYYMLQAHFLSDTEGWGVGDDKTGLEVWQYHNGQWQTVLYTPLPPETYISGLGANSSTDVWVLAVGGGLSQALSSATPAVRTLPTPSTGGSYILLHFDGHAWASMRVDAPADAAIGEPAAGGRGSPFLDGATWLPTYAQVNHQQVVPGLLLNQGGHWSATTFPKPVDTALNANTAPDGSTLLVAAMGAVTESQSTSQTLLLLRYANGKWRSV